MVQIMLGGARRATLGALVWLAMAGTGMSHAATLPDGRGYELVSPAQKNGGDVRTMSARTHVASDGNAVVFPSYVAFGDAQGSQIDTEYLAQRTGTPGTQGWAARGITPRQEALSFQATAFGVRTNFEPTFAPDLSSGVYRGWRPLVDAPNVANVSNLYRIDGLRAAAGGITLLSNAFAPVTSPIFNFLALSRPTVVGASTDLDHIVFESRWRLTPDAPVGFSVKLYESSGGVLRLAGVLPDDTAADGATATQGDTAMDFYPVPHCVSSDGSHVFFAVPSDGNIYVRLDGATTAQLNASEKTTPEAPAPATLWSASADGSRAFFITNEGLVDGDDDGSPDLYMYDETAPIGSRLSVLSPSNVSTEGVIGASDDGRYVYFVTDGTAMYVWHDGAVSPIGGLAVGGDAVRNEPTHRYTFLSEIQRARVAPDGRHLLFETTGDDFLRGHGGFAGYDHAGHEELYIYSADSGALACASCNPTGRPATDDALDYVLRGFGADSWQLSHALSDDGRWVFFNTGDALVPEDANGKIDAYEYDVVTGSVHLLSSGADPSDSFFVEASRSGRDVFIATREQLVGWDVDDNYDMYDVRVNGGFPEPVVSAPACGGEACQGQPAGQPVAGQVASQTFRGAGDAKARLSDRHRGSKRRCTRAGRPAIARKQAGRCRRKRVHHRRAAKTGAQRRSK